MKKNDFWRWLPRILAIAYILFLALFALDVFAPNQSLLKSLMALAIHLAPNYLLIAALVVAWKREDIGGILFLLIGLGFYFFFNANIYTALILIAPLLIIGGLFLINFYWQKNSKI
ncbi:MAG: hypothetical protein WCX71_04500 [Candidatus Buchananbacteria bacterium]